MLKGAIPRLVSLTRDASKISMNFKNRYVKEKDLELRTTQTEPPRVATCFNFKFRLWGNFMKLPGYKKSMIRAKNTGGPSAYIIK